VEGINLDKTEPISILSFCSSKGRRITKEESDKFYTKMLNRKKSKEEDISRIRLIIQRKKLNEYFSECHTERNTRGRIINLNISNV